MCVCVCVCTEASHTHGFMHTQYIGLYVCVYVYISPYISMSISSYLSIYLSICQYIDVCSNRDISQGRVVFLHLVCLFHTRCARCPSDCSLLCLPRCLPANTTPPQAPALQRYISSDNKRPLDERKENPVKLLSIFLRLDSENNMLVLDSAHDGPGTTNCGLNHS